MQEKADRAAKTQRQRDTRNAAKPIQLPQKGKRKVSKATLGSNKRQKQGGDSGNARAPPEAPSAPPPVTTRHGRSVNLPSKYK